MGALGSIGLTSNEQTITIPVSGGLPGIPVADGGNYTDANGQQWTCDEIDIERHVYIQRIGVVEYHSGSTNIPTKGETNTAGKSRWLIARDGKAAIASHIPGSMLCNVVGIGAADDSYVCKNCVSTGISGTVYLYLDELASLNAEQTFAWLKDKQVKVQYILVTPVETDLPDEVIDAFQDNIRSHSGDTVVSNDAGAHMALEYLMDARKYIDKMISTGIHEATLE